jgi:8-oxo-dGTP diphosphatase
VRAALLRLYPLPRFRVGVLALVVRPSGEILLLRHRFREGGAWGLPGGWVEPREAPRDALARELHEELALVVDPAAPELLAVEARHRRSHVELFFLVRAEVGEVPPNIEFTEVRHFPVEALPEDMLPLHRELIPSLVRKGGR